MTTHHHKHDPAAENAAADAGLDAFAERAGELAKREEEIARREAELSGRLKDLTEALARSQADHRNLLNRLDREKAETHFFVVSRAVGKVLPALDNLDRALAHVPADRADDAWTQGVRAARQTFLKGLEALEVVPFDSVGQPLDESRHEAVAHVPGKADTVVAEIEKGYLFGERVLRHAKVAVGNGEGA